MLMLLGVSTKMTEKERDVVVPLIMRGFKDSAMEAGTMVTGGQTVVNPWCTIGGVATTVCQPNEYIVYVSTICIGFLTFIYNFCKKIVHSLTLNATVLKGYTQPLLNLIYQRHLYHSFFSG